MIARSKRFALRAVADYRHAFGAFSENARRLLLALAIQSIGAGMLTTVFAIYIRDAGLSESVVGGVEGFISLSAAIVCLVGPPMFGAFRYRSLLLASVAFYVVARGGMALLPVAGSLLVFALVNGVGEGLVRAMGPAFYAENSTARERPFLFSVDLTTRVFASAIGALLGGFMPLAFRALSHGASAYQLTVWMATAMFAVSAIPMFGLKGAAKRRRLLPHRPVAALKAFKSWRHVGMLLVVEVTIGLGAGLIVPFVSLYLKRHLGASIAQVGIVQGVMPLWMGAAALTAPFVVRKFGLVRGMVLVEAASIPFLIAIPFIKSLWLAAVVFWLRAAFMNMSNPLYNEYSMTGVSAREKPLVAGWIAAGWSGGFVIGSLAGGRIMEFSYTAPYYVAVGLYVLGIVATGLLLRERDAEGPPATI